MAKMVGGLGAIAFSFLLSASSCGGGGGGGGAPTNPTPATTQAAFISQYCDIYRPCCTAAGLPATGASCRDSLTMFPSLFLAATYDPAAGDTCLVALRAAAAQPGFCETTALRPVECDPAFGQTGTLAPGAPCGSDNDCAPSSEGRVACFNADVTRNCQVQIRGKAGDGPCVWTVDVGTSDYSGPPLMDGIARSYVC